MVRHEYLTKFCLNYPNTHGSLSYHDIIGRSIWSRVIPDIMKLAILVRSALFLMAILTDEDGPKKQLPSLAMSADLRWMAANYLSSVEFCWKISNWLRQGDLQLALKTSVRKRSPNGPHQIRFLASESITMKPLLRVAASAAKS